MEESVAKRGLASARKRPSMCTFDYQCGGNSATPVSRNVLTVSGPGMEARIKKETQGRNPQERERCFGGRPDRKQETSLNIVKETQEKEEA